VCTHIFFSYTPKANCTLSHKFSDLKRQKYTFNFKENYSTNTFETLGVSLQYLEHIIGLKNSFLYGGEREIDFWFPCILLIARLL